MKLYEAFFLSLSCSLLAGGCLFLGLPFICGIIIYHGDLSCADSAVGIIFVSIFSIYAVIQFSLSVINLFQAIYLDFRCRLDMKDYNFLQYFAIAEAILYLLIFVGLNIMIQEPMVIPFIIGISIPFIICCTFSIYLFRFFLRKI